MRLQRPTAPDPLSRALRAARDLTPTPWSIEGLVAAVGEAAGYPLEMRPDCDETPLAPDMSGAWMVVDDRHYIVYRREASPTQRDAAVCHELGHILCGHEPLAVTLADIAATSPLAARILGRSRYDSTLEAEAEAFATRFLADVNREARTAFAARLR